MKREIRYLNRLKPRFLNDMKLLNAVGTYRILVIKVNEFVSLRTLLNYNDGWWRIFRLNHKSYA